MSKDQCVRLTLWVAFIFLLVLFLVVNFSILTNGTDGIAFSFLMQNPESAGRSGGIFSILLSTLWIVLICLTVAVPISLGAAIVLSEFAPRTTRLGYLIGLSLDILAAVPSIVFGLFGNAVFSKALGLGFSLAAGGLTLACMVIPILIRSTEESLRAITNDYRMGAAALALSKSSTVLRILLPTALPGLFVGLVIGIGRAVGETAALIFTSGYVDRTPESILDSGRTLAVHIFDLAMNVPGGETNAHRTGFVLLIVVLALNSIIALTGQRWILMKD